jgi:arylsulfatase
MDRNVGRLLAALEAQGIADDTLVLFLSDNGGCAEEPGGRDPAERRPGPADDYVAVGPAWGWAQNAPFRRYKVWMHEGGIRTPLIARWPGKIPAGAITDQPGHILDMMPTLLELAGGAYPVEYEGRAILPVEGASLVPVLAGARRTAPSPWCWQYNGNAAIRQGDWKLAWDKLVGRWELYDLSRDPTELQDLAAEDPLRVAQMASAYAQWAAETGNRVPRGAQATPAGS